MTQPACPPHLNEPLFESVPNLSVARDAGLLRELRARMDQTGVEVIDHSADADHRRSVWTWLGSPAALEEAARQCLALLNERRTLDRHRGVHPRTGLFDVFPWVPLAELVEVGSGSLRTAPAVRASTLDLARDAARAAGARLAETSSLPVFFYEHAAASATRRDLAQHRRELLRSGDLRICAQWPPDAGPTTPHARLGVLLVGARRPLIAFNFDLGTDDAGAARSIAAAIRQSARDGLPGVKALGLFLPSRGCAQVSVNLVGAHQTDLPHLASRVRFEARARGERVLRAERIGLLTETAVGGASAEDLGLDELRPEHFVETHLRRVLLD